MSAVLNKVQLIGNVGAEPKFIESKNGERFATLSIATNEYYQSNGEKKEICQWHDVVIFGDRAKVADYIEKGDLIYIDGSLRMNKYKGEDDVERKSLNIVANNIQMLGKKNIEEKNNETV